ncbi:MAG: PAS domain S-box protein [Methanogenium sp.]
MAPLITDKIRELNTDCNIYTAESAKEALILLKNNTYDLIICTCTIKDLSGTALVEEIQEKISDIPLIVIATKENERTLLDALYRGLECTILPASDQAYTMERIQQKIASILKKKRREEAFETYNLQLSGIITHIPDPTFAIDLEGRVIVWNKAIEELTGVPAEDVLGKGDYEYAVHIYGKRRPTLINMVTATDEERRKEYPDSIRTGNRVSVGLTPIRIQGVQYYVRAHASPIYDSSGIMTGAVQSITNFTDLKDVEDALRESEAKFRGITERISDLVVSMDSNGVIVYVSPSVKTVLGYEPEYLLGNVPKDVVWPEDLEQIHLPFEKLRRGEQVKGIELHFRKEDGTYAILEMSGTPILENNIVTGMQVIGRDITGKKTAEEHIFRLLDEQKELLGIIDKSPAVAFLWKAAKGCPVEQVTENVSQLGYTARDFLSGNITFDSVIHPNDREGVSAEISYNNAHHVDDFVLAYRIIRKDTAVHWVEEFTHIRRDTTGKATHYQGVIVDITQRKAMEDALHRSQADYQQLFESSLISLWEMDFSQGKEGLEKLKATGITDFNQYFNEHPEEIGRLVATTTIPKVNKATLDLLEAEDYDELVTNFHRVLTVKSQGDFQQVLVALAEGRRNYTGESSYTTFSGKEVSVIFQMVVVPGYGDTPERILISLQDITARKKAEMAVLEVNKKLSLLGNITRHDILNQLTVAQGYMELIEIEEIFPQDSQEKNYAQMVSGAIETIKQEILFAGDYQDVGEQAPSWFHVGSVIEESAGNHAFQGIRVKNDVGNLEIYADPLFKKVIYNLFDNSLNHGERVTEMTLSCVQSKSENPGGIDLICKDNGVGVPDSVKEKIFRREHYTHTGFGLFLSREILSITGLSIKENGEEGKGARFVIHVPQGSFRVGE